MSYSFELPVDEPTITVPDAAEGMRVPVTKVHRLIREHALIPVIIDGVKRIPAVYFDEDGSLNKHIPGVTALLSDGGYSDDEILGYLFTADDSLPGRPVDCLHGHLAREVMRRAQAMAL